MPNIIKVITSGRASVSPRACDLGKGPGVRASNVAISLNNLAELYRCALAILEKTFGPEHPNTIKARSNLVKLQQAQAHAKPAQAAVVVQPADAR